MENKDYFHQFCKDTWADGKLKTSGVMWEDKINTIISALETGVFPSPGNKHKWLKIKHYFVAQPEPKIGITKKMLASAPEGEDRTANCKYMIAVEDFWAVISFAHEQVNHLKTRVTYKKIKQLCIGIPENAVEKYVDLCLQCQVSKQQVGKSVLTPTIQPIVSVEFMERGQLELIDFSMNADGEYKWAALFIDHYSKFSVIWPMKNRTGKEVAETLRARVFGVLGCPRTLQADEEYIRGDVKEMVKRWPGECNVVCWPCMSPSFVEPGSRIMKGLIKQRQTNQPSKEWVRFLPDVAYEMNHMKRMSTGNAPMQIVFGVEIGSAPMS